MSQLSKINHQLQITHITRDEIVSNYCHIFKGCIVKLDKLVQLQPLQYLTIPLGITIHTPHGIFSFLKRTQCMIDKHIYISNPDIDEDNSSEIKITLFNPNNNIISIEKNSELAVLQFNNTAHNAFQPLSRDVKITPVIPKDIPDIEDETSNPPISSKNPPCEYPIIRTVDKVSSTVPKTVIFTLEDLRRNIGFLSPDRYIQAMKFCAQPTVKMFTNDREPILNLGEVTTIARGRQNKIPTPRPPQFGDVFHGDIGYGCKTALGVSDTPFFLLIRPQDLNIYTLLKI